jgi:hypothetical protein
MKNKKKKTVREEVTAIAESAQKVWDSVKSAMPSWPALATKPKRKKKAKAAKKKAKKKTANRKVPKK